MDQKDAVEVAKNQARKVRVKRKEKVVGKAILSAPWGEVERVKETIQKETMGKEMAKAKGATMSALKAGVEKEKEIVQIAIMEKEREKEEGKEMEWEAVKERGRERAKDIILHLLGVTLILMMILGLLLR